MKKFLLPVLLLALVALALPACSSSDNAQPDPSPVITSGSWKVHLFIDSGNDETSNFTGWTFTFNTNGTVSAIGGGPTASGTWSVRPDDGRTRMEIEFPTTSTLAELNNDWVLTGISTSIIELEDDNASSNEVLHFQKK